MAPAEETSLAEEQRVWFGLVRVVHLAGSRVPLFTQVKGEISPAGTTEEPLDCGKDNMLSTCAIPSVCIVSVLASAKEKPSSGTEGAPGGGGLSDLGWRRSRSGAAAFGSTFHTSCSPKLISEECVIWRLAKKWANEAQLGEFIGGLVRPVMVRRRLHKEHLVREITGNVCLR